MNFTKKIKCYKMNTLNIIPTYKCNNNCIICPARGLVNSDKLSILNLKQISDIINKLMKDVDSVIIVGGEPTITKNLPKIISKILNKNSKIKITLYTNGRIFSNKKNAYKISQHSSNIEFKLNLYSHNEKIYESITRTKNSFNQTIDGIKNLIALKNNVDIVIVLNKKNINTLPETIEFIYSELKGIKNIQLKFAQYIRNAKKNKEELFISLLESKKYIEKSLDKINKYNLNADVFFVPLCIVNEKYYKYFLKKTKVNDTIYTEKCKNCTIKNLCSGIEKTYYTIKSDTELCARTTKNYHQNLNLNINTKNDTYEIMKIDKTKCINCNKCISVCPVNAITKSKDITKMCIVCNSCSDVCPQNAIYRRIMMGDKTIKKIDNVFID